MDTWLMQLRQPQSNAGEQVYALLESVLMGLRADIHGLVQALPAASLSVAEPAELPLPLLEEEHRAPMAAASRPASHDSDILAMLAQSLEGNCWSMVQGSPAHYSMFRRGLGRLAQRLADLPATGLPALVEALIAQADSLPISGPSAWAAEAVSQALETLGDALLSLPTPSTTFLPGRTWARHTG